MKRCNKCCVEKSAESFSYTGYTDVKGEKTRRGECKDCQKARQAKSRVTSKAKGENKYDSKWYKANKEKAADRVKEWRKYNMDKAYTYSARSRAKHRYNTEGTHTQEEWKAKLLKYNCRCTYCNSDANITKDHVVPLSKGGTDNIENIVPACRSCNSSKGNKTLEEWLGGGAV